MRLFLGHSVMQQPAWLDQHAVAASHETPCKVQIRVCSLGASAPAPACSTCRLRLHLAMLHSLGAAARAHSQLVLQGRLKKALMRRIKPNRELLARHLQPEDWWMASPAAGDRTHLRLGCLLGSLARVLSPSTVALQHAWRGAGAVALLHACSMHAPTVLAEAKPPDLSRVLLSRVSASRLLSQGLSLLSHTFCPSPSSVFSRLQAPLDSSTRQQGHGIPSSRQLILQVGKPQVC